MIASAAVKSMPNRPITDSHLLLFVKELISKQCISAFRALPQYSAPSERSFPGGELHSYGPSLSASVRQTMVGSRATASKRFPRLSTRGDTLSAGPKSTIRT